jgi:acetylornithine deacetylase/succinyl-diaminopimelate desuccinylase-like protein
MDAFHAYVDAHTATWVERLREAVAVDSVSSDPARRPQCVRMMEIARDHIVRLGGTAELNPIGEQTFPSGETVPLPPIVTGCYPAVPDAAKKTVLVYGHLDVQPASMSDAGWEFDPFTLTEKDGKLYGRGATDDKGPVLAWLWAIESYKAVGLELPVNLKFILEGMEESGSEGFDDFVLKGKPEFFKGVDATCISDNYYLGPRKPCVTYGLRGLCYFMASIKCARADMHSGVYGGSVREAMVDLVKLLATLNTADGGIAVPGIMDAVRPFTVSGEGGGSGRAVGLGASPRWKASGCSHAPHLRPSCSPSISAPQEEEKATYKSIDFDPAEFAAQVRAGAAVRQVGAVTPSWRCARAYPNSFHLSAAPSTAASAAAAGGRAQGAAFLRQGVHPVAPVALPHAVHPRRRGRMERLGCVAAPAAAVEARRCAQQGPVVAVAGTGAARGVIVFTPPGPSRPSTLHARRRQDGDPAHGGGQVLAAAGARPGPRRHRGQGCVAWRAVGGGTVRRGRSSRRTRSVRHHARPVSRPFFFSSTTLAVRAHLDSEFAKLGSPNTLNVHMDHGARAWMSSFDSPNYVAGE